MVVLLKACLNTLVKGIRWCECCWYFCPNQALRGVCHLGYWVRSPSGTLNDDLLLGLTYGLLSNYHFLPRFFVMLLYVLFTFCFPSYIFPSVFSPYCQNCTSSLNVLNLCSQSSRGGGGVMCLALVSDQTCSSSEVMWNEVTPPPIPWGL